MTTPATRVTDHEPAGSSPLSGASVWTWLALFLALVGTGGSLWLSMGMDLKACPLCFYQRSFVMGIAAILLVGLLAGSWRPSLLSLLCMPLATAGLGVALFHVNLERNEILECPKGVLGVGSAPQQSLATHVLLLIVLAIDVQRGHQRGRLPLAAPLGAMILGAGMSLGCIKSSPPLPEPPNGPYKSIPDTCRRPYQEK
jgi:disulfide bond formation protein DsbB